MYNKHHHHLLTWYVPVALHVLPAVVHAAAPRGHVLAVEYFGPLLTEHRHLVPHKRQRAAVDLRKNNEMRQKIFRFYNSFNVNNN